jgi:hypothetical protein
MTTFLLRLSEEEHALLRAEAEREGRSMHDVARTAVLSHIASAQRTRFRDAVLAEEIPRWQELLDRLADA